MPIILCNFAALIDLNTFLIMKYEEFTSYRKWFNKNFSLSFDGKFKGLSTIALLIDVERLAYRLFKILSGRYRKPVSDVICIRLSGHVIKLYAR